MGLPLRSVNDNPVADQVCGRVVRKLVEGPEPKAMNTIEGFAESVALISSAVSRYFTFPAHPG